MMAIGDLGQILFPVFGVYRALGGLPEMALKELMQGDGGMVTSSGLVELLPPKVLGESRLGVQYYTSS